MLRDLKALLVLHLSKFIRFVNQNASLHGCSLEYTFVITVLFMLSVHMSSPLLLEKMYFSGPGGGMPGYAHILQCIRT